MSYQHLAPLSSEGRRHTFGAPVRVDSPYYDDFGGYVGEVAQDAEQIQMPGKNAHRDEQTVMVISRQCQSNEHV